MSQQRSFWSLFRISLMEGKPLVTLRALFQTQAHTPSRTNTAGLVPHMKEMSMAGFKPTVVTGT